MKEVMPDAYMAEVGDEYRFKPCDNCGARFVRLYQDKLFAYDVATWYMTPHVCNLGDQRL